MYNSMRAVSWIAAWLLFHACLAASHVVTAAAVVGGTGSLAVAEIPRIPGYTFVLALPLNTSAPTVWREDADAACTRVGLTSAGLRAPLSATNNETISWTPDLLQLIAHGLGAANVTTDGSAGCCAASAWCRWDVAAANYTCYSHAFGSLTYTNYGWQASATDVPVYMCAGSAAAAAASRSSIRFPIVSAVRLVMPLGASASTAPRLQVDGYNISSDASSLRVSLAGAQCTDVDACHALCAPCTSDAACAPSLTCVPLSAAYSAQCLRSCNDDNTCPCGQRCFPLAMWYGQRLYTQQYCLNTNTGLATDFCRMNLTSGGMPFDRVECTLPSMAAAQVRINFTSTILTGGASTSDASHYHRRALLSTDTLPAGAQQHATEQGRLPVHARREHVSAQQFARLRAVHQRTRGAHASAEGEPALRVETIGEALPVRDDVGRGGGVRRALSATQVAVPAAAPYLSQPAGGYAFGGVCPWANSTTAPLSGLLGVAVTSGGFSSTGLDALLVNRTNASSTDAAYSAYALSLGVLSAQATECATDADCTVVDTCNTPRCEKPLNASLGCCVYARTAGSVCDTSEPWPMMSSGQGAHAGMPSLTGYIMLPATISATLPLPGPASAAGSASSVAVADMGDASPTNNPFAALWDARNYWYAPQGVNLSAAFGVNYQLSTAAYADDQPLEAVPLSHNFSMWGANASALYVSPNGFVRVSPWAPCWGSFIGPQCSMLQNYTGMFSPLVADFNPGGYRYSSIWWASFDMTSVQRALGIPSASGAAEPAALTFCTTFLNMGLWQPGSVIRDVPDPSFSTHMCLYADGAVRWRYGGVLNARGVIPGATRGTRNHASRV
ncbi:MAG: hypothetical protein EOO41_01270, partial [Methanobacteriota archaeon]